MEHNVDFDVIVVGLGHAGCEAALAAARRGARTLGVTLRRTAIAVMSCNPAIGGTAKGHLVRELDALGGAMGEVADRAGTHFKRLNASRGAAVQATRVLCDRDAYAAGMRAELEHQARLTLLEAEVSGVLVRGERVAGVRLSDESEIHARCVVLTTGTFLHALMHVGEEQRPGGRVGDAAAVGLSGSLRDLGFELGRFKTGTPPRLLRRSLDFARCEAQLSDAEPEPFSLRTRARMRAGGRFPGQPTVTCHITYTTEQTHEIIRSGLGRSPLYRGVIKGLGPRYCPSVEDKVVRFSHRERHQVFLEPETPTGELVYPAGLSTSLPGDIQLSFLRTIPGLERVELGRPGYAVEYDFLPPTQLKITLESKSIQGLFFAGQLNGTSGYEEAAFQGFIAGVNASGEVRGDGPFILGREEAHGAVLIDDLVTLGVDEPFRMFTSRSEHRLKLREGNADLRLRHHGLRLGLVSAEEARETEARARAIDHELCRLDAAGLAGQLRRPGVTYERLSQQDIHRPPLPVDVQREVEVSVKYAGYIAQAERESRRGAAVYDDWAIPTGGDLHKIPGLSTEAVEKLLRYRPETIAQARRIPGMTPVAINRLVVHLRSRTRD